MAEHFLPICFKLDLIGSIIFDLNLGHINSRKNKYYEAIKNIGCVVNTEFVGRLCAWHANG